MYWICPLHRARRVQYLEVDMATEQGVRLVAKILGFDTFDFESNRVHQDLRAAAFPGQKVADAGR